MSPLAAEITYKKLLEHKCVGWSSEYRKGSLYEEVIASSNDTRYMTASWNNQTQPIQPVLKQYRHYVSTGFDEIFFTPYRINNPYVGVWVTCFVGFLQHDIGIIDFLNRWYLEGLSQTTQDQVSFPYIVWTTKIIPYTFPDLEISGDEPHFKTAFYIKHSHGK